MCLLDTTLTIRNLNHCSRDPCLHVFYYSFSLCIRYTQKRIPNATNYPISAACCSGDIDSSSETSVPLLHPRGCTVLYEEEKGSSLIKSDVAIISISSLQIGLIVMMYRRQQYKTISMDIPTLIKVIPSRRISCLSNEDDGSKEGKESLLISLRQSN